VAKKIEIRYFSQLVEGGFEMIPATLDGTVAEESNSTGASECCWSGRLLLSLIVVALVPEQFGMSDEGWEFIVGQARKGQIFGVAMRLDLATVNAWYNPKFDFTGRHYWSELRSELLAMEWLMKKSK
jgi:hypothetical protein